MIDSIARGLCLLGMALCRPARRGLTYVEGHLARAEYRLRMRTGALFVVLAILVGCGGVERHARTALDVSAHALVAADVSVAEVYERRAEEAREAALAAHPGPDEDDAVRADYRERMRALDAVETALRASRTALLVAESGLDAGDEDALGVVGCVADALDTVLAALVEAGVDPPPKLRKAVAAIRAITGDRCGGGS